MELIGEHLGSDISTLPDYEVYYKEGDKGEVRFYISEPVDVGQIEAELYNQGVTLTKPVVQDAGIISIKFEKRIAPLAIIAIVVGGIAVIGAGLLGWQIFKSTQLGVPIWVWLVAGGSLLYLILTSKPAKEAGGLAIRAGKIYVTKKAMK